MTKHATPPASYKDLCEALAANVPAASIKQRDGGGNSKLSYVQDKYQRTALDEIFGPLNWGDRLVSQSIVVVYDKMTRREVWDNAQRKKVWTDVEETVVVAQAVGEITVTYDGKTAVFQDVGVCDAQASKNNAQQAYVMAIKGAATDAFKRCAFHIGNRFGRGLESDGTQKHTPSYEDGQTDEQSQTQDNDNAQRPARAQALAATTDAVKTGPAPRAEPEPAPKPAPVVATPASKPASATPPAATGKPAGAPPPTLAAPTASTPASTANAAGAFTMDDLLQDYKVIQADPLKHTLDQWKRTFQIFASVLSRCDAVEIARLRKALTQIGQIIDDPDTKILTALPQLATWRKDVEGRLARRAASLGQPNEAA